MLAEHGGQELCAKLAQWAEVARIKSPQTGGGALAVLKSDLLGRLTYGGESAPSETPCPVHNGEWSGLVGPRPGWIREERSPDGAVIAIPLSLADCDEQVRAWWAEGC